MHTGFWCGNLNERNNQGNQGVGGRIILNVTFRIGPSGGLS